MAEKVKYAVATASFDKDNYARRMMKRIIDTVNKNADILEMVENPPFEKIATYTSEVNDNFPADGISWADFTPTGTKTLAGAKSVAIEIQGISVGALTYGNKSVIIKVLDSNSDVIIESYDSNANVSFELFKMMRADSGELYAEHSGRAPSSATLADRLGFSRRVVGMSDGTIFPAEIEFADVNIIFDTNKLTQNTPIVFTMYAQY